MAREKASFWYKLYHAWAIVRGKRPRLPRWLERDVSGVALMSQDVDREMSRLDGRLAAMLMSGECDRDEPLLDNFIKDWRSFEKAKADRTRSLERLSDDFDTSAMPNVRMSTPLPPEVSSAIAKIDVDLAAIGTPPEPSDELKALNLKYFGVEA